MTPLTEEQKEIIARDAIIATRSEHSSFFMEKMDPNQKGFLMIFEGADGAGKTTMAKKVAETLTDTGLVASYVRTPGGTVLGEILRGILLSNNNSVDISIRSEAYMFMAQLNQCVTEVIKPKLDNNEIVICDRLIFSALAYQGIGRGMSLKWLFDETVESLQGIYPTVGFMMSNPNIHEKDPNDKMEMAGEEFTLKVNTYYNAVMEVSDVNSWMIPIEVERTEQETLELIFGHLLHYKKRLSDTALPEDLKLQLEQGES